MIKVYKIRVEELTEKDFEDIYNRLNNDIKALINAKQKQDKQRSLAGYYLLFKGAFELYGKTNFQISFNQNGKPMVDFCYFSISHTKNIAVCVFDNEPIGVDVQYIPEVKRRIKYRFFNQTENEYVNRDDAFLSERYIEIFTKKEAAVKMLGLRLVDSTAIDTFSNKFFFSTQNQENFILTVCKQQSQ